MDVRRNIENLQRFMAGGAESPAAYLRQHRHDDALERVYEGYGWAVPFSLFREPVGGLGKLLRAASRYEHEDQKPLFYLPFLEARPWWPQDDISRTLTAHWAEIKAEFLKVDDKLQGHPEKRLVGAGNWSVFNFYRNNERVIENCSFCPQTDALINQLPICPDSGGLAYFSIMAPGTYVKPHCAFTNTRIRYHLGLEVGTDVSIRVGQDRRPWIEADTIVFDDSFEHEVFHEGAERRAILLLDCWHPQLSAAEQTFIRELMRRLRLPS